MDLDEQAGRRGQTGDHRGQAVGPGLREHQHHVGRHRPRRLRRLRRQLDHLSVDHERRVGAVVLLEHRAHRRRGATRGRHDDGHLEESLRRHGGAAAVQIGTDPDAGDEARSDPGELLRFVDALVATGLAAAERDAGAATTLDAVETARHGHVLRDPEQREENEGGQRTQRTVHCHGRILTGPIGIAER